jgi:hypothetical protein
MSPMMKNYVYARLCESTEMTTAQCFPALRIWGSYNANPATTVGRIAEELNGRISHSSRCNIYAARMPTVAARFTQAA